MTCHDCGVTPMQSTLYPQEANRYRCGAHAHKVYYVRAAIGPDWHHHPGKMVSALFLTAEEAAAAARALSPDHRSLSVCYPMKPGDFVHSFEVLDALTLEERRLGIPTAKEVDQALFRAFFEALP